MAPTPLGYALIGLAIAKPRSGYALRNVFETSPLGAFSSSPGSIYPALAKLVKAGLLEQRAVQETGKALYHVTDKGRAALHSWLTADVTVEEVANNIDVALLRFAFLESSDDVAHTHHFLTTFERAVKTHLGALRVFMRSPEGASLSDHGRLAMEFGISGYKTQLTWAGRALTVFSPSTSTKDK